MNHSKNPCRCTEGGHIIGWRIDYFFISNDLADSLEDAYILQDVHGSDHCPVGIRIKLKS